jgi:hypothetical protein
VDRPTLVDVAELVRLHDVSLDRAGERHRHPLKVERPRVGAEETVAEDPVDRDAGNLTPRVGKDAVEARRLAQNERSQTDAPDREAPESLGEVART